MTTTPDTEEPVLVAYGWAPGGYMHTKCRTCDVYGPSNWWDGDKRAYNCKPCAEKLYAAAQLAPTTPDTQDSEGPDHCPFCGSKAHTLAQFGSHYVICDNEECDVEAQPKDTPEQALALWNRRTAPPGWKLVPIEPTEGMIEDSVEAFDTAVAKEMADCKRLYGKSGFAPYPIMKATWTAMVSASTTPPTPKET